ncbi:MULTISPECIES: hypothetical protein [unclassified Frondihabitans]|uniref:hypothetical protein n=1 Tax=unclassified Frondihabitans TaxID=2626248 RepID=UPI000F4D40EB|nr:MULTISPECIES: hypothetical protein [unclassified Frondihabitans]RPE78960.1 hypothetical protein EDF37_1648 [Frondihabitans sp. PhB153]RPF09241.1 hypothetical protein EDF39_1650 [Frondihabitans sp. PhB161]
MGVQNSGETVDRILRRPAQSHPYAHGSFGFWLIEQKPAPPLGWVLARSDNGVWVLDAYAHCRDAAGKRPWLRTFGTLNSAVAWMLQHEGDIRALMKRSDPEPD